MFNSRQGQYGERLKVLKKGIKFAGNADVGIASFKWVTFSPINKNQTQC